MANVKTVNDLSEITLVDDGDFLLVWSVSAGRHRKAKKVSLFGSEKDAGFGTTSPQAALHVFRPGKVAEVRVESASDDALITLDSKSKDAFIRFQSDGISRFVAGYDASDGKLKLGPSDDGSFSGMASAIEIDGSGNVEFTGNLKVSGSTGEWHTPTMLNGWKANTVEPPQYRRSGDRVELRGVVSSDNPDIQAGELFFFLLPEGFRPSASRQFSVTAYTDPDRIPVPTRINVFHTGYVSWTMEGGAAYGTVPDWFSLNGIFFSVT